MRQPVSRLAAVVPPFRCWELLSTSPVRFCGEIARYARSSDGLQGVLFFCPRHSRSSDVPIAGEQLVRVITLRVDALFASVTPGKQTSQLEALDRFTQAVAGAGGLVNLHDVTSETVRYAVPAASGKGNPPRGAR